MPKPKYKMRQCANPNCHRKKRMYRPVRGFQKYCSPECKNDLWHATHVTIKIDERKM
jgi:hypothetical protein